MMSNTMQKDQEQGYIALYEELEARYGAALAQQIVDQIKKADKQDNRPEYMAVKAVSETLELFRGQTRQTLQKLKQVRLDDLPADIANLGEKRLQNDLVHLFTCYWLSQQAYYKLYNRAVRICEVPETYRYERRTRPTKMAA